jgi:hypothetical protein
MAKTTSIRALDLPVSAIGFSGRDYGLSLSYSKMVRSLRYHVAVIAGWADTMFFLDGYMSVSRVETV